MKPKGFMAYCELSLVVNASSVIVIKLQIVLKKWSGKNLASWTDCYGLAVIGSLLSKMSSVYSVSVGSVLKTS